MKRRFGVSLAVFACSCLLLAACQGGPCTEIGCYSTLVVDYGTLSENEPYDLYVTGTGVEFVARCNDDESMEADANPDGLDCHASGFTFESESVALTSSVTVTIVRVSDEEPLVPNIPVSLTLVNTDEPNGPDCPPVCYVRHGTVVF